MKACGSGTLATIALASTGLTPGTTISRLIDLDHAVIVDVEASTAVRQAEVMAACTMIERVQDRFGLWPERLAADSA